MVLKKPFCFLSFAHRQKAKKKSKEGRAFPCFPLFFDGFGVGVVDLPFEDLHLPFVGGDGDQAADDAMGEVLGLEVGSGENVSLPLLIHVLEQVDELMG